MFADERARERQALRYVEIEEEMVKVAERIEPLLLEIDRAGDPKLLSDPDKAEVWADRFAASGLPLALMKVMTEVGFDEARINEMASLVSDRWLMDGVKRRGLLLAQFASNLRGFVAEVRAQRVSVLAGETYVYVEGQEGSEAPFVDREEQARARPNH